MPRSILCFNVARMLQKWLQYHTHQATRHHCPVLMAAILLIFCMCCLPIATSVRVVSSNWKMTRLADFEQVIMKSAQQTSGALPKEFVNFLSSIQAEYSHHVHLFTFVNYPVNMYRLIRRFTYDWPRWMALLKGLSSKSSAIQKFIRLYEGFSKHFKHYDQIQDGSDFLIATNSLSLLHLLYGKETGLLESDHSTNCPPLTELELLELCADSFKNPYSDESLFYSFYWLQLFLDRVRNFFPYWSIKKIISYVIDRRDLYGVVNPRHGSLYSDIRMQKLDGVLHSFFNVYPNLHRLKREHFERLETTHACRAPRSLRKKEFYCFLFHSPRQPFAPFKYEILSRKPYVALVHDFMPFRKTFAFIQKSIDIGSDVNQVVTSNKKDDLKFGTLTRVRLSESTVIHQKSDLSKWLDFRVEHATLLQPHSQPVRKDVFDGETNHILHYGLSGYYIPHVDYFGNVTRLGPSGDRLATVLIYLTDVESGGNTVFPKLGLHVAPQAGAAVVWFNQHPVSGRYLAKTLHAACPVNIGKKWVINRWILNHSRIAFSRPIWKWYFHNRVSKVRRKMCNFYKNLHDSKQVPLQ